MQYGKFGAIALVGAGILLAKKYSAGISCKVTRDLRGKLAIITGGNTGIGKETAVGLAQKGCYVIIAGRDVKKSLAAVEQIKRRANNPKVEFIPLDLGSKASIDQFSSQVKQNHNEINYLINNAGVSRIPERIETVDKFQMQFGTNHLGHFYLTYCLWDTLRTARDLRIINVSSRAHKRIVLGPSAVVDLKWDNLNFDTDYVASMAYSRSKLANVLFTQQLADRLQKVNPEARCVSLHPGVVRTEIGRYALHGIKGFIHSLLTPLLMIVTKSPLEGAQTTLHTVLESPQNLVSGEYYSECQVDSKNPFAQVPENQKLLWAASQRMLGIEFPGI